MIAAGRPQLVCLACKANDQQQRIGEIAALAAELGGRAEVQPVSPRITAVHVTLPPGTASRFTGALALSGGVFLGDEANASPDAVTVLLTCEPDPPKAD